jgi:hypothetical protein
MPCVDQDRSIGRSGLSAVDLAVIDAPGVNRRMVRSGRTGASVSALVFTPFEDFQRAVQPDKEHIVGQEQTAQLSDIHMIIENMLHDEVIACGSKTCHRPVKTAEECGSLAGPVKLTGPEPSHWQNLRIQKVINGEVPERRVHLILNGTGEGGFSAAGWPVQQDDPSASHVRQPFLIGTP